MKKVSNFVGLALMLGLFATISGCKKEYSESHDAELQEPGLSVDNAFDWFEKNKSGDLIAGKSGSVPNFTPDWKNALTSEDAEYYIVECPAKFSKQSGFSIKKAADKTDTPVNGLTKLLVLKSKKEWFYKGGINEYSFFFGICY